jgi:hypothetical protein
MLGVANSTSRDGLRSLKSVAKHLYKSK